MRNVGRILAALVTAVTLTGGTTAASSEEADRLDGDDAVHAEVVDLAAAATILPRSDLGIAHRLPGGGMNLWRMTLSELGSGFGTPQLVKTLNYGGFSYDNSRTLAGDFGDITPSDDGTADHVIWHAQPNGGVLVWAVGGGADTTPRLWQDLRMGGWSWANSRPMVGDMNGDGWDDLVVQHQNRVTQANIWVFLSDGQRLGAPQLWSDHELWSPYSVRYLLANVNSDYKADLVRVMTDHSVTRALSYTVVTSNGTSGFDRWYDLFTGHSSGGWSFDASRQLAGDVSGDGITDLLTVHAQPNGGILVWVHKGCISPSIGDPCFQPPVVWQDLRTGGWSFAGSRQHLVNTNGDGKDDLLSVHSQTGNPGMLVWRHVSSGAGFLEPQVIADLKTGGWSYSVSREGVAGNIRLRIP